MRTSHVPIPQETGTASRLQVEWTTCEQPEHITHAQGKAESTLVLVKACVHDQVPPLVHDELSLHHIIMQVFP